MAINTKKPAYKLTVGAQYICFAAESAADGWDGTFDAEVTKYPTVVNVQIEDNGDSATMYASGKVYDQITDVSSKTVTEENIAFPDAVVAKMKGDTVQDGIVISGGQRDRPYFAYGYVKVKSDGSKIMRWFPKCKLSENSDETATSTDSHSDQNDTLTVKAMPFNDNKDIDTCVDTSNEKYAAVTEEKFFAKPITSIAEAAALIAE